MKDTGAAVSLRQAFFYWLKLGFISFGGPAGQLGMMHQELVEKRGWISEQRFLHALNYCMLLPGPEAQQLATYIGWLLHGTKGALLAGLLFILPSFFMLSLLAWVYLAWGDMPLLQGALYGIKPAVTAIVLFAAWRIGKKTLHSPALKLLALTALLAIAVFKVPFPAIVLGAAISGWLLLRYWPAQLGIGNVAAGNGSRSASQQAVISDTTPLPTHQLFSWRKFSRGVALGLGIWLAAMAMLVWCYGWQSTQAQLGWFFSKAALLTFGGAYAVLPYVYQGAVEHYGWLSALQMMDALALGESTPGPLIMVVSFVGFVAGWSAQLFGAEQLPLAGAVAAAVVTFFTFLPSFLFILLGAPLVEASRQQATLAAPLSAITAAVVGVIVNLALFFGYFVLFPHGTDTGVDWRALLLGLAAALALFRYQQGIVRVLAACAAGGILLQQCC